LLRRGNAQQFRGNSWHPFRAMPLCLQKWHSQWRRRSFDILLKGKVNKKQNKKLSYGHKYE